MFQHLLDHGEAVEAQEIEQLRHKQANPILLMVSLRKKRGRKFHDVNNTGKVMYLILYLFGRAGRGQDTEN
jgi:hypothetical protein